MVSLTGFESYDNGANLDGILTVDKSLTVIEWILIDEATEFKLTLLSKIFYGSTDYTDLLADFNEILNPLDITINQVIKIPDLGSLTNNVKTQSIYDSSPSKPINSSSVLLTNKSKYSINNGVIVF